MNTSRTKSPILTRSVLRTSSCPEGKVISETVLRPLSAEERRAGKRDEYTAWVSRFGDGTSIRHKEWRGHAVEKTEPAEEEKHADLPEELQLEIYREMLPRFKCIARQLIDQGVLQKCDREEMFDILFEFCRDAMPGFDPEKSSRTTFLWNVLERKRASLLRKLSAKKRQGTLTSIAVASRQDDDESVEGDRTFSEEDLADPRSIEGMIFNWAWSDLENLCAPDERLALHMLYCGYTPAEVASRLKLTPSTFRRTVHGPLQLKCDCVGFSPRHAKFILN